MLSGTPLEFGFAAPPDPLRVTQSPPANSTSLPVAPFPLEETFQLHSDATATKTIYLDFEGFTTRNTQWNSTYNLPNIVTPAYSLDGDYLTFSDTERLVIQAIWEHVSEDFRPFDVDVTTEDPGVEALRNTGGADDQWGVRIVIGGSDNDWQNPVTGKPSGGIAFLTSFSWDTDTPAFVFGADYGAAAFDIADAVSHESGHTLGLSHDGLIWFWQSSADSKFHSKTEGYYTGHPRFDPMDPMPHIPGPTDWTPIMGAGYGQLLSQWSKGEYPGANNIEDDLLTITTQNGFGYRPDDHGDTMETATPLDLDPATIDTDVNTYLGEGIIGEHPADGVSDIDYFSFTVGGIGEILSFDISPFQTGPNLDILAKIYDSSGNVIATSNPLDDIAAGGQTFGLSADGGWLDANGQYVTDFTLLPGTYYLSVEGTGKPITFIDPMYHPVIVDPMGAPDNPMLPFDHSDWGYSNYGSLGYYSITGTRKKGLVVGVDFDEDAGTTPLNWNLYSGGAPESTLKNLISETGDLVPYQLTISTTGTSVDSFHSTNPIDPADIPNHTPALDELGGYIAAQDETLTFTWSNLDPWTYHQVYVFGHADFEAHNVVTITGGNLNGTVQTIPFTQTVSPDGLEVNAGPPGNEDLSAFAYTVLSDGSGQITITVTNESGFGAALAGLAISPTIPIGPPQPGSISGQKWNDLNGNKIKDPNEPGLAGWIIYQDLDDNGQLNLISTPDQPDQTVTQSSPDVPQSLQDYTTVKSELDFQESGQILDVDVALDISHTYDADLDVYLISPLGTRVKLFANVGLNGDNFTGTVFDDSAIIPITAGTAPFTNHFRPQEPLSGFNGEDALGLWKLELTDDAGGDTGTLNSWSITVKLKGAPGVTQYLEPYTITDGNGNYSFGPLDPGLYHIREYVQPQQVLDGWQQTWAPIPVTVTSGADRQNIDFGNWIPSVQRGSIQGQKFYDANQNGMKDPQEVGLPGWIVYVDSDGNGVRDFSSTPTVISATDLPQDILDPLPNLTQRPIMSQVTVGSLSTIFNVEVTLDITHSFVADLDAYLVSPSGTQVQLFSGVGGQYNNFNNLTLSDSAQRSISTIGFSDLTPTGYTGTWQPQGLLSDFNGEDAAGIWTLVVSDTAFADQGTLNSWSLKITSGELFRTTDDNGNYEFDNLLPGDYIIREEPQTDWTQVPPATTDIPGATWDNSQWAVTIVGVDDINDPDGPDSHRNVKNVDFGNHSSAFLPGDYNTDGVVNAADYVVWRKSVGANVPNFSGADGNGDGGVDQGDLSVWRANFDRTILGGGSGSGALVEAAASGLAAQASESLQTISATKPIAVKQPTLSPEVLPEASTAAPTESLTSPLGLIQQFASVGPSGVNQHEVPLLNRPLESTSNSDLALMAWLATFADGARPQADGSTADNDFSVSPLRNGSDTLDVVFEMLEGRVLAAAAI